MAATQQQPVSPIAISPTTIVGPTKQQWTTGILGCFSDCGICCTTCCCPCVQFGHNTEAVTGQSKCCIYFLCCCILPCCCLVHAPERTRMREAYNLEPECGCHDCICSIFCQHCSICQEAREIKARGPPQQQKMGGGTQMSPVQTYPQPATPYSPGYPQYAPQGYPQGYPPQPYPPQPYSPQQGYPPQQQYPPQGYPQQQYPPQQYSPQQYQQPQYAPAPDAQQAAPVPAQSPPQ